MQASFDGKKLEVKGSLTIETVELLYKELEKIFNDGECEVIDLSDVEKIDTSILQVLIAFSNTLRDIKSNISFVVNNDVKDVLKLTGADKFLLIA